MNDVFKDASAPWSPYTIGPDVKDSFTQAQPAQTSNGRPYARTTFRSAVILIARQESTHSVCLVHVLKWWGQGWAMGRTSELNWGEDQSEFENSCLLFVLLDFSVFSGLLLFSLSPDRCGVTAACNACFAAVSARETCPRGVISGAYFSWCHSGVMGTPDRRPRLQLSDLALGRLQVIRERSLVVVSAEWSCRVESTSLVKTSCQGNLNSADYQTDRPVNNTETVSLPCHFTYKLSSLKPANPNNRIIIPITDGDEASEKAPGISW